MTEVNWYDVEAVKDDLQRQIWDLEKNLQQRIDDVDDWRRDSDMEIREGLNQLDSRLSDLRDEIWQLRDRVIELEHKIRT